MAIKQSIKNNIVSANNKYNLSFEKVARILSKNEEDNNYDISIVGSDGISSLYENISIRYDGSDAVSKICLRKRRQWSFCYNRYSIRASK